LRRSLGQVHEGGRDQRRAEQNDKTTGQRAAFGIQGVQERTHGRRITRQLEEAHEAQNE
jgi:hypothetical protein